MVNIKEQLAEVSTTYGVIAEKLEALIELMNQKVGETTEIKQNAVRIIGFMRRLVGSVENIKDFVDRMIRKNKPLEISIEKLFDTLRDLSTLLGVVAKKGKSDLLIKNIARGNDEVKRILNEQKALLRRVA
ncbi:hypothetical protein HYT55_02940 [Candidatus Woesearchaeota archaeon]|nr:hypothetical protein [Candidatus Woesearchaeota archaeon]